MDDYYDEMQYGAPDDFNTITGEHIYLCKFKTADDIVQYMSNDYYLKTKKWEFINCLDHTTDNR